MKELDDMFRDGLGQRRPEVPEEVWENLALDRAFKKELADREAVVPKGIWKRIQQRRGLPVGYWTFNRMLRVAVLAIPLIFMVAGWVQWQDSLGADAGAKTTVKAVVAEKVAPQKNSVSETAVAVAKEEMIPQRLARATENLISSNKTSLREVPAPVLQPSTVRRSTSAVDLLPTRVGRTGRPTPVLDLPAIQSVELKIPITRRQRLSGEFLLGGGYASQSLTANGPENEAAEDAREFFENQELSLQFSARVRYLIGQRFRLISGLTYAELRNQLDAQRTTGTGTEFFRSNNKIRIVEVPVLLGYELPGKKINATLNAGALLNLWTGVSGSYVDPAFIDPLDLRESGYYRKNTGIGFMTSITTTYRLGRSSDYQLMLEPWFKAYPTAFTVSDAPVRERYWTAGLQLGIRKQF